MVRTLPIVLFFVFCCFSRSFGQTDTSIGLSVSGKFGSDHEALSAALCIDQPGEKQKANAIYNWITHNISYDVAFLRKFPKHYDDKAGRALSRRNAVCEGYSALFVQLCRDAGLQAVSIEGYAKDWIFDNGDEMYIPRHEWSAVRINGKWELVDATWGAGGLYQNPGWFRRLIIKVVYHNKMQAKDLRFRFKYDPQYFMQNPETFRLKHVSSDPLWQLTDTAMPLAVFEAGDSAIRRFNELSTPRQSDPRLDKIAPLDEKQKLFEFADRAYAYNKRYPVVMAVKASYRAEAVVKKAYTDTTVQSGDIMLRDATNDLKKSLDYIKQQKKIFPEEYNKLKKKNKAKGMDARQSVRVIKTDDKKLIAECKKHTKSGDNKQNRARKKLSDVQARKRGLNPGKIDEIETAKVRKKEGDPQLYALKDSVAARDTRIDAIQQEVSTQGHNAKVAIIASSLLLDSLVKSLNEEDSMLRNEAIERMSMHDSYDDEVKKWSGMFGKQKYKVTDTLLKYYFAAFDSIVVKYEKLTKTHVAGLDLYKGNVRSLEQYKKWNNTDATLKSDYAACINNYVDAIDSASTDIAVYVQYLQGNKKLFDMLNRMSKRQIKIVDYMEKAEKRRQSLEAGSIARKKAFDLKENEHQRLGVQKGLKQVQAVVDRL